MSMQLYYEQTALLRDRFRDRGYEQWAEDLLAAERSAFTSGEAITNIELALNRIRKETMPDELRTAIDAVIAEGDRIWHKK